MPVEAVQHIRRMRGGAQSHFMRADDGHFYVVKFQNNPQHLRVLANELIATRLAEAVGLPVPVTEIITVREWLIQNTPELQMDVAGLSSRCKPGLQFGARFVCDPAEGQVFDYLPESMLPKVRNLAAFAGMLVVDKWLGNANGRQAVFWKKPQERKYTATFIDQGYCFNAGEWNFPDSALRGVYARNLVYQQVCGWESFEPWLTRVENLAPAVIHEIAGAVPPVWTGNDWSELEKLAETMVERRSKVRELITAFRNSTRQPFPAWSADATEKVSAKKSVVQ
ncbi:MAG TPA: HipA family kinase [Candidatus Angelobacter sp.]|nr:HipA family kinase [Candidatus Angelobacter sp.]